MQESGSDSELCENGHIQMSSGQRFAFRTGGNLLGPSSSVVPSLVSRNETLGLFRLHIGKRNDYRIVIQ